MSVSPQGQAEAYSPGRAPHLSFSEMQRHDDDILKRVRGMRKLQRQIVLHRCEDMSTCNQHTREIKAVRSSTRHLQIWKPLLLILPGLHAHLCDGPVSARPTFVDRKS